MSPMTHHSKHVKIACEADENTARQTSNNVEQKIGDGIMNTRSTIELLSNATPSSIDLGIEIIRHVTSVNIPR
jgi:hypothetical protein